MAAPKSVGVSQSSSAHEFIHQVKTDFDMAYNSNPGTAVENVLRTYSSASQPRSDQVNVCKIVYDELTNAEAQVSVKRKAVEKIRVQIGIIKGDRNVLEDVIDDVQYAIREWSKELDLMVGCLESECLKRLSRARGEIREEKSKARLWAARVELYSRMHPDAIQV